MRWVTLILLCVVGVPLLAGAATAADASDDGPAGIDGIKGPSMDELDNANESGTVAADVQATTNQTSVALVASATGQPGGFDTAVPSEATLDIWAGVFNDSEIPEVLPGEDVEVTIGRPDGETESFTRTTDAGGSIYLGYDLSESNREPGDYSISVEHDEAGTATDTFEVGTSVDIALSFDETRLVGSETELSVAARDGETPEVGAELNIVITRNGDPVLEENVTTDGDGFASVGFTPTDPDVLYFAQVERDGEVVASRSFDAAEAYAVGDFRLGDAIVGDSNFYGGYVLGSDGPVANEQLVVEMFNDPFDGERTVFVEENVTTDEHGFFGLEYEIDDPRATDPFSIDVDVETADGNEVDLEQDSVSVNERFPPGEFTPEARLTASFESFRYAPGETAELTVAATDANGEPITGESVELFFRHEFDGPPFAADSVTLDANGEATVEVPIDENAPDGLRIRAEAALEYQGNLLTASESSRLETLSLSFPSVGPLEPGEETTVEFEAIDRATGEGAEDVLRQMNYQYSGPVGESFASVGLETSTNGTDEATVEVPEDVGIRVDQGRWDRDFNSLDFPRSIPVEHPGELSLPDKVEPGEDLEVTVDADGKNLTGIVFSQTPFGPRQSIGTRIDGEETVLLTVPETANAGFIEVAIWAADANGTLHTDRGFMNVEQPVEANFAFEPAEPGIGEEVTFNASTSVSDDGDIVEYRWDFTGDGEVDETTDDPVTTHTYETGGAVSASLEVNDEEGQTSLVRRTVTVQPPEGLSVTLEPDFDGVIAGEDPAPYNVTVENIGVESETQLLEFTVEDAAGNLVFDNQKEVTVGPESEELVTFVVPSDNANQVPAGFYNVTVSSEESDDDDELFVAAEGTFFEVDNFEAPDTGLNGSNISVTATVTNLGAADDTQNVTVRLNESGAPLDEDAIVATDEQSLASGEGTTVEFVIEAPEPGDYDYGVFTQNDSETAEIEIDDGPGDVTGDGNPAQDPDGNGLYEDVDGDGEFDIFDVQAFFENYEEPVVQNSVPAFDFDGDDEVDIFDVQELFEQLS